MSMADTLAIVMALAVQGDPQSFNPMDLPPTGPEVTIAGSPGGGVQKFAEQVIDYDRAGTRVRLMGSCVSACTLVLALPADRICVGPRAAFGFHEPFHSNVPGVATSDLGDAMFDAYPGFVKAWLKGRFGGLPAGRPQFMGDDVLRQHYRTCG